MASYNKVILLGRLAQDPQLSYLPSQTPVVDFGLAVNRQWNDKDGTKREDVCFIDCQSFGKVAETIKQYMTKGRAILVEGRLQLDQWEDKEGRKRSKHKVIVESFQFLNDRDQKQQAPQQPAAPEPEEQDIPF